MKTILLTGAAGFIGARTVEQLAKNKDVQIVAIDNLNDYYDVRLKEYRRSKITKHDNVTFHKLDIEDLKGLIELFEQHEFSAIINLAARAGVRYSMINPFVYQTTNAQGTLNLLELCHTHNVKKFILASTSSLYAGLKMPFKESLSVNTPFSPYAASKKAAEAMCHAYHYLYGIDVSVLRYFTVYGPAGRPDMSIFRFIKQIDTGKPIEIYGDGTQSRDFTYVDDIAEGTIKALKNVNFETINLGGGNNPYALSYVIQLIEDFLGKKATIKYLPFHVADMKSTWADISKAKTILDWQPTVPLEEGIQRTVDWYKAHKQF